MHWAKFSLYLTLGSLLSSTSHGADTIKIGILHSLTGTMAISESVLKDTMQMLIQQQNEKGGVLGRQLEAVILDPGSDWPRYAAQARQLINKDKVDVIFGGWTSASRKAMLPVVEELNGLLFYPVQYEGEESSENIFYTGASPNQQAIPAVDYLMNELNVERWVVVGTDYVYPRTTSKILEHYLKSKGVKRRDMRVNIFTPFSHKNWGPIVRNIRTFAANGQKVGIISTVNGDSNTHFYQALADNKISAEDIPVVAFSVGEQEFANMDTSLLVGHLAAWNYFMSVEQAENQSFIKQWQAFTQDKAQVTNDPMEAHYIGFNLWVKAVEKAGSTQTNKVKRSIIGLQTPNLTGGMAKMLPNHHITKPVFIGRIRADKQFDVVWKTDTTIPGDAWSDYLPSSQGKISDWRAPINCGYYEASSKRCLSPPS